ncbi:hypothetical protein [Butyrivibrio sp. AC2005]|uniref:hypothetical protein n=1 Tax=Butyrivibrio sp. AC2005 TaxID=1280672 RepID=UPI00040C195B|nr:hypothetical protein [Butyrivibrio sp. AC2005]
MRIDIDRINPAFKELIKHHDQVIFLDANIFIPPDRSNFQKHIAAFRFEDYRTVFLDPLLLEFPKLSVHETVYDEMVVSSVKAYVDEHIGNESSGLEVHYDRNLSEEENALLNLYLQKLSVHSGYDPAADNSKDRGEIRSLSYMAVKRYLYFTANDALPIRLIKNAKELETDLDDMGIIQPYELIFYLYESKKYDGKGLRILYKYLYYLTARDKIENPEWGKFVEAMEAIYEDLFDESR